jgi:PPK2 family polyphosphate:nucleotide phosphotransferase
MKLDPVTRRSALSLDDRSAGRPAGLPDDEALKQESKELLERLGALQAKLYADGRYALLVVLQGRDASGKDGTVRKVFGACNPLGCQVTSFKVPTPLELSHDFLWRIHQATPAKGMIGIFNRSQYEDVLVVRVRDIVPKKVWAERYAYINEFERTLDANGTRVLKFFLHVSRDEQRKRLLERLSDPDKNWKFRAGDLDDRALWGDYTKAYRDALRLCSTPWAPWYVVPADDKKARNYFIAQTVVAALEALDLRYPKADRDALKLKRALKQ